MIPVTRINLDCGGNPATAGATPPWLCRSLQKLEPKRRRRSLPAHSGTLLFLSVGFLWLSAGLLMAADVYPGETWQKVSPEEAGMDAAKLRQARDYALTGAGSGYITRGGRLVMAWGDLKKRYDLKSTTKSFGAAALGLAIKDGKMKLSDPARKHHSTLGTPPESNAETGWLDKITILHLASQTAGFEKPGGYTKLLFEPGTKWDYSDSGPNWLAECVTLVYRRDVNDLMFARIFRPIGIQPADLVWRKNAYRPDLIDGIKRREFGAGISANVDAMARFGYLHLQRGKWKEQRILTRDFVDKAASIVPGVPNLAVHKSAGYDNASSHYGLLWWNNADGTLEDVPKDACWSWGLYDSLILVIPSLDIVVARAGQSWKREPNAHHYDVLKPFFGPVVAAVKDGSAAVAPSKGKSPYPPSPVIKGLVWAPAESVIRRARGSDNWPLTWADDDALYTAYGDGHGFEPKREGKLSMGLAKVIGDPPKFTGTNLVSPEIEQIGDGARGRKASGILMVEGVLYLWARNAGNSQLAWSEDHGRHWHWSEWKFTESFGYPAFLNFGKNYAGARDDFVYVSSHDSDSAYQRADRMVQARVAKDRIKDRAAYEFFERLSETGEPVWTRDIARRGAVFRHPGHCYRSGISYNPVLKRYLWCQTGLGEDTRFRGGLAIYDAPEPWGPWTTVFYTDEWDLGPGETSSFPTRWMSADGKTLHLVFSGDDCFSVRRATVIRR